MKRTLGITNGRVNHRNITVKGVRFWKRKRSKKTAPIFYVTYRRQDGKRVSKSTRERRRNVAVSAGQLIARQIQPLLFPTVEESQPTFL